MTEETKNCPYCGETILKKAKKCKHCGEWLEEKPEKVSQRRENKIDKEHKEDEEEVAYNIYKYFVGANDITHESVIKKLKETKQNIIYEEYKLLTFLEKKEYSKRVNWYSLLLYPLGFAAYFLALFFQHPWRNLLIMAVLFYFFGNPFSDLNRIVQDDETRYCTKLKIAGGEKREFCSANEEDLKAFKDCVNNPALKFQLNYMSNMTAENLTDKDYYAICKNVNVYEIDREKEKQELTEANTIAKAVKAYQKEQIAENAKKFGVSKKCAEDYLNVLKFEGVAEGDFLQCTKDENIAIKNYWKKEAEKASNQEYTVDYIEPLYTNNGMPKSLVLKDVPIKCFEKANWGDNSSCTKKQLNTIKQFFAENKNINWESEYFEY